jgi:hypothetical protein
MFPSYWCNQHLKNTLQLKFQTSSHLFWYYFVDCASNLYCSSVGELRWIFHGIELWGLGQCPDFLFSRNRPNLLMQGPYEELPQTVGWPPLTQVMANVNENHLTLIPLSEKIVPSLNYTELLLFTVLFWTNVDVVWGKSAFRFINVTPIVYN